MQASAFNTDSKEAPCSIYAEACRYYYTISMWIVTKILHAQACHNINHVIAKATAMQTRGRENDHFAYKFIFSHVNSQSQLNHTDQQYDYLSQLLKWPK